MRTRHWSLPVVHDSSLRLKSRPRAADQSGRDNPFMAEADTYSRRRGFGLLDQPYLLLSMTSLFWAINTVIGRLSAGTAAYVIEIGHVWPASVLPHT